MKINIKAMGMELTPAIEDYLRNKLSHLERFLDPHDESIQANVELGKITKHHHHGEVFRVEVNLHLSGRGLRAEAVAEDIYPAIDKVKDELIAEVKSYRQKKTTLFRRGGRKIKNMLHNINPWKK